MSNKLIVAPSPHIRANATTAKIMRDVVIALVPAGIAATFIFGVRALMLMAVCVLSSVAFEYLFERITGRKNTINDYSAVVTGLLLSYNVPVTLPFWMAIIGAFFAIVVVKQLFGGIGKNFANPAIVGRIFLLIAFATPMTNWLVPKVTDGGIDLVAGATPLALMAGGQAPPELTSMLLGLRGGCIGETCILALLIGGVYLIARKVITVTVPLAFLGTVAVGAMLFGVDPLYHLLAGGAVLGAFYMATDYTSSPVTEKGRLIFGIGCGLITIVIRVFGSYPEGVSFAILLMNIITPHIDKLTKTKPFGGVK